MGIIGPECKTSWTAECLRTKASGRLQRALETFANVVNQGDVSREVIDNGLTTVSVKILLGNRTYADCSRDFNKGMTYRGVGWSG